MKEPSELRKFRETNLRPDEQILDFCGGYVGKMMGSGKDTQHNGVLILTSRRVVFYAKGLLREVLEQIPNERITSVETKSLIGHHQLVVYTSNNELEFKTFDKAGRDRLLAAIEERRTAAPQGGPAASEPSSGDTLAQLERLAALRDRGALTEEEFQTEKAKVRAHRQARTEAAGGPPTSADRRSDQPPPAAVAEPGSEDRPQPAASTPAPQKAAPPRGQVAGGIGVLAGLIVFIILAVKFCGSGSETPTERRPTEATKPPESPKPKAENELDQSKDSELPFDQAGFELRLRESVADGKLLQRGEIRIVKYGPRSIDIEYWYSDRSAPESGFEPEVVTKGLVTLSVRLLADRDYDAKERRLMVWAGAYKPEPSMSPTGRDMVRKYGRAHYDFNRDAVIYEPAHEQ